MDYRKKLQNIWFYYKKPILIGLAAVLMLSYLAIQKANTIKPDYHIGLVRTVPCTEETLQALEDAFTAVGVDCNGDGQVLVQIHTYYADLADESETAGVKNADAVQALDADLIGGMSGIFLLEDVETFRRVTGGILADDVKVLDGGIYLTLRKDAGDAYLALAEQFS